MRKLDSYKNQRGETFTISIQDANVPEEANYWGYFFIVKDSQDRQMPFSALIQKTIASEKQYADAFVMTDPLDYLKDLLESTVNGQTPLVWPMRTDWIVMAGRSA